jgi:hypothetical protein
MVERSRATLVLSLLGAFALAACGDASVGNPRADDYGGGGSTGDDSTGTGGSPDAASSTPPSVDAAATPPATPDAGAAQDAAADPPAEAGGPTQTASFTISVDKPQASLDLADTVVVNVSITPNGFHGNVDLAMTTMPANVTASFATSSFELDGTTVATTALTLATSVSATTGDDALSVTATSTGMGNATTPIALTVNAALTITIPANVDNNGGTTADPVTNAFGPYPMTINGPANLSTSNTLTVRFYNADTIAHEIHASSPQQGFAHDPGPFPAMSMDPLVRHVNTAGTYDFYLHDQGAPTTIGRLVIQ